MRTLDPRYERLETLLIGQKAPTWLVEWVPFRAWASGDRLTAVVEQHYARHGTGCDERPIYLRRGVDRSLPDPECN